MKMLLLLAPLALVFAQSPGPPIENEFVRVVFATDQPNRPPGALHEHKQNRVMIYLDPGDMQIKYSDGRVDNQHWKTGDVAWSPAGGMHTSQNVSAKPIRIVEIELKNAGSKPGPAAGAILNNAQARVVRTSTPPKSGHYVAVDVANAVALWDKMPEGAGPFVVTEIR